MTDFNNWYTDPGARDRTSILGWMSRNHQRVGYTRELDHLIPTPVVGQIVQFPEVFEGDDEDEWEEFTVAEVKWTIAQSGAIELFIMLLGASLKL